MSTLQQRIEKRLQQRIDRLRQESPGDLPEDLFNPLFLHLPEVIKIVASIKDYSTEPYLEKMRSVVCAECSQNLQGQCVRRSAGMCGLNEYFPMIVGAIEAEMKADPGTEA